MNWNSLLFYFLNWISGCTNFKIDHQITENKQDAVEEEEDIADEDQDKDTYQHKDTANEDQGTSAYEPIYSFQLPTGESHLPKARRNLKYLIEHFPKERKKRQQKDAKKRTWGSIQKSNRE